MAAAAVTSPSPDPFTFHCPAAAALSAADKLFSGGKLMPLHRPVPASAPCSPPSCLEVEPASEPTSPHAPRCAGRRWRDLLLLISSSRKPKAASGSGGDASKCVANGYLQARRETHFRSLLSRDSSSSSSASSVDSGKNAHRTTPAADAVGARGEPPPPRVQDKIHRRQCRRCRRGRAAVSEAAGAGARRAPAPDPSLALVLVLGILLRLLQEPSRGCRAVAAARALSSASWPAVAVERPRVSASGRMVFRGLERCSSTPASAGIGRRVPRPRAMERSYSANVRVDPVINLFGFRHLFMPSSPAKEKKADKERDVAGRRNRPEKLAMVLRDQQD